jgi:hypothetical protein
MGVAVGVFVVTAMAAAVHAFALTQNVDAFGATSFQVRRRGISSAAAMARTRPAPNAATALSEQAAAIRRLPGVQAVTVIWGDSKPFRYHDRYLRDVGYDALSSEWLQTDAGDISPGRNFSALEEQAASRVVIINDSLQSQLFADGDPIGKEIQIASQLTVIGVYHAGRVPQDDGWARARQATRDRSVHDGPSSPRALGARRRDDGEAEGDVVQIEVMDDVTALLRDARASSGSLTTSRSSRPSE